MTLDAAIAAALVGNRDLISAGDGVAAALAGRVAAGERPNPTFSASLAKANLPLFTDDQHSGRVWDRTYDWIFSLQQLVELGGKRNQRVASAEASLRTSALRRLDSERLIRSATAQAYVSALATAERRRLLGESALSYDHEAEIARQRQHAGDLAAIDFEQIEVAAAQARSDADDAVHNQVAARLDLQTLLGHEGDDIVTLGDDLIALEARAIITDQAAERGDLAAARASVERAAADLGLAHAGTIVDPTIGIQYEHNPVGDGLKGDSVGVSVSIPLPIFNHNSGALAQADAGLVAARHELDRVRAVALSELAHTRNDVAGAKAKRDRYLSQILPRAEHAWDSVSFAYSKGAASLADLLAAGRAVNDARLASAQARADAIISSFAMRTALGLPPVVPVAPAALEKTK